MGIIYTTNSLIESVKLRGSIPQSQSTFLEADFITFANEEMNIGILPLIKSFHEDNLSYSEIIPLVTGQTRYEIPHRAIGNKLIDVYYIDGSGSLRELTKVSNGDLADYNNISDIGAFYIEGDSIILLSSITTGSLKFIYEMRPNILVSETRGAKITSINSGELTLDSLPTTFTSLLKYDIIKSTSPYNCIKIDLTPVSIGASSITFNTSDLPTNLKIGDYVCLAEETIIVQTPPELYSLLAQRVVARCLEALGDQQGLMAANAKIAEMESKAGNLIDSRVDNAPSKVKNRTGFIQKRWW